MRPFSNIIPNFAANLHLLVDSIKVLSFDNKNKKNGFLFCIMLTFSYLCSRFSHRVMVD